jgi:hypothetical protein
MIHPTAAEVLATVLSTFSREIVPDLTTVEARSSGATIEHLLRHVLLRLEHEGEILMRDIARLRRLLDDIAGWLEEVSPVDAAGLRDVLAQEPAQLCSLGTQGVEALRLRGALVSAQETLERLRSGFAQDEAFLALKSAIGAYIAEQLVDEAMLIEPAFSGKGPRR